MNLFYVFKVLHVIKKRKRFRSNDHHQANGEHKWRSEEEREIRKGINKYRLRKTDHIKLTHRKYKQFLLRNHHDLVEFCSLQQICCWGDDDEFPYFLLPDAFSNHLWNVKTKHWLHLSDAQSPQYAQQKRKNNGAQSDGSYQDVP